MKDNPPASRRRAPLVTALVADVRGEIFELEGYGALGMSDGAYHPLEAGKTLDLPHGSELMYLPDRRPVVYNLSAGRVETLPCNPFQPEEPLFPVAAFNSPGYVIAAVSAYEETEGAGFLPLFSYGAVGWHQGRFRSAVIRVDRERLERQDLRLMPREKSGCGGGPHAAPHAAKSIAGPFGKVRPDLRMPGCQKLFSGPL